MASSSCRKRRVRLTPEQREKHNAILRELRRLERVWNGIEQLSPASIHYIQSRLADRG